ncbi:FAD/FMN-containing dehydrogenase [Amycolatopsis sulphurea]|uniref:FAD/FMN-containing dehydrogenase n=1 Tax=Amycolatopsis sulphurea TaxID=76022 RepID=A0A2A9G1H1_9PSEU|nr:FAD-binding oxidoreductase [Amycolatopsis sulphurea]PFG57268.1 FAD/FMN-containing dehydrogenase [Amycolatopsis sulphurea]
MTETTTEPNLPAELPGTTGNGHRPAPVRVSARDARYGDLVRGKNQRWVGRPDYVCLPVSTSEVRTAVQDAVSARKRISVRSGGHCYEDFVYNPDVEVVIDLSEMTRVSFDREMNAFSIEAGAELLDVYETIYRLRGVTFPGGMCYSVGAGGHICGGGYGFLSRKHGLVVDYLYAVEVVVVDQRGKAKAVIATREADDPRRDLWWAHTGGGGGNFGVVTRYWLRAPEADTDRTAPLLPSPPAEVLASAVSWEWASMTEAAFRRLLGNFADWQVRNQDPESPAASLFATLSLNHRSNGQIGMMTQMDASVPNADKVLAEFLDAVAAGVEPPAGPMTKAMGDHLPRPELATPRRLPWLQATQMLATGTPTLTNPSLRAKYRSAYLRSVLTDDQIGTIYRCLTSTDYENASALLLISAYGAKINAVPPRETAVAQRDAVMKLLIQNYWSDPADDAYHLRWIREFYRDVFAETGGVPPHDDRTAGCYVSYPDVDLDSPEWNSSGLSGVQLYYGVNYPRLRAVKRRWDPGNVFRHRQSIRP